MAEEERIFDKGKIVKYGYLVLYYGKRLYIGRGAQEPGTVILVELT